MEKIFMKGVQDEWIECASFLQRQLYVETSSVQASVQVQPHIVGTALKYLTFCNSVQALGGDTSSSKGQDASDKTVDEAFPIFYKAKPATA